MTDKMKSLLVITLETEGTAAGKRQALFESVGNHGQAAVWEGFRRATRVASAIVTDSNVRLDALARVERELKIVETQKMDESHYINKNNHLFNLGENLGFQFAQATIMAL